MKQHAILFAIDLVACAFACVAVNCHSLVMVIILFVYAIGGLVAAVIYQHYVAGYIIWLVVTAIHIKQLIKYNREKPKVQIVVTDEEHLVGDEEQLAKN